MKKLIALLLLTGLSLTAAACNTVEGMGQDIKGGGQAIENTADDAKPSNNPNY